MAIGDLYDADNVIVGQAAVLVSPAYTALPDFGTLNLADPFDPSPWVSYTVDETAATTFTLTYGGDTTSALTKAGLTAVEIQTALEALDSVGAGNVTVGGATGAWTVAFTEAVLNGSLTATGTGGAVVVTGGLWVPVGATDQGWKYGTNKSVQSITIEEQSTPVGQAINTQSVTIEGSLSEDITRTLALAYNGVTTVNAPTADTPGYDEIALTDDVIYYAVALITQHFNGMPRIVSAPKWTQLTNTSTTFRRSADKRMYPVSFATVCKPSQILVDNFTAAKTS